MLGRRCVVGTDCERRLQINEECDDCTRLLPYLLLLIRERLPEHRLATVDAALNVAGRR